MENCMGIRSRKESQDRNEKAVRTGLERKREEDQNEFKLVK